MPRRLDEERPVRIGPTTEAVANVRDFVLSPREFTTRTGGLFLFIPDLVRLDGDRLAQDAKLPGSRMIPAAHALRASLALKLWSIERKSHVMALVADEGLALFCGLNAMPKKSFLSEYSSRITPQKVSRLLAVWHAQLAGEKLFPGESLNLDFHSVPYFGEHPVVESHYLSKRSRRQPSILTFLAQDAEPKSSAIQTPISARVRRPTRSFASSNSGSASTAKRRNTSSSTPSSPPMQGSIGSMPPASPFSPCAGARPTCSPKSPTCRHRPGAPLTSNSHRKYRNPQVYEQKVRLRQRTYRQFFIKDLGHDEPTILLTNDATSKAKNLITRYAKRMLIENALADAVRFFHIDALSSSVGFKVDFDMALLVLASGLYRLMARRMRGYDDAQARQIFRDLIDMPADVAITENEITVRFHRRAHLPIVLASGLIDKPVKVPWWSGRSLRLIQ